ncbi:hypothetical protein KM043_000592 [Ampulex compressa]|nr:hypothetical protein KM043_000592 [Ampulex compressa]
MVFAKVLALSMVVTIHLREVYGHGMLMDPVNRGSAWRVGYDTPVDFTDNENFCGGFTAHYVTNKGKCGECGDDYSLPRPRSNENGGYYGTGTIVRTYKQGSVIKSVSRLSANHMGTFQFSLCPLTAKDELETEECFQKYPLLLADGSGDTYHLREKKPGDFVVNLKLPAGVTCEHCVLRWHYRVANSWGKCEDGSEAMGCGNQETFRSCSDIKITA